MDNKNNEEIVNQIHKVLYNMMCDVDDFCKENDIRYYLAGGTCLGAVRHQGFIPWDDDADFIMPRPDYEKFLKIFNKAYPGRYRVESLKNNRRWNRPFARVWDMNTEARCNMVDDETKGIFADIFPIDGLPEGKTAQSLVYFRLKVLNVLRHATLRKQFWAHEKYRRIKKIIAFLLRGVSGRKIAIRQDRIASKYPFNTSKEVGAILSLHYYDAETIAREKMEKPVYLMFEGRELPVPAGFDTYLRNLYGDYMVIPKGAKSKHVEGYTFSFSKEE